MNDEILKIENLHINYETKKETVKAVNGVSLKIGKGEVLGLVGETGAGKTTTALSIMKLLPERTASVKEGSIEFDGVHLDDMDEDHMQGVRGNRIAMIFQDPMTSLNPVQTVGEQIGEALRIHNEEWSKDEISSKTNEMLNLVGISESRKKDYPHQFSGGMKQRVIIAMALACNPELLIADEPTTALDVTIQAQVLKMMSQLKEKLGTSMMLITHDLGVVAQNCDAVAIMYAGEIIEYGTAEDVFEGAIRHPYTEGLFNSIPKLNVKSNRLEPIEGLMPNPAKLPGGCKFHPRCKSCMDICRVENPGEIYLKGHMVKCHLHKKA